MSVIVKVVSLARDQKRRFDFRELFDDYLRYEFYDAVDGHSDSKKLSAYHFVNNGVFRDRRMGKNERACSISHYEAIKSALVENKKRILILEDDLDGCHKMRIDLVKFIDFNDDVIYILGGQEGMKLERLLNISWRLNLIFTGKLYLKIPFFLHKRIYRTCCYMISRDLAKNWIGRIQELSVADDWEYIVKKLGCRLYYCPIFSHPLNLGASHIAVERGHL